MQIEHDPKEKGGQKPRLPDYGEKKWAQDKYGREASPSDLFRFLIPIVAVAVVMFLWRGY